MMVQYSHFPKSKRHFPNTPTQPKPRNSSLKPPFPKHSSNHNSLSNKSNTFKPHRHLKPPMPAKPRSSVTPSSGRSPRSR